MSRSRIGVFLDRDGTLNHEVNYVRTPAELHLIPGAGIAVSKLNEHGLVTCVISNQSGVARGYLAEKDLIPIHAKLNQELARDGGRIDRIYYCPHHPTDGIPPFNIACDCRKPKTGMLRRGVEDFGIELGHSFVVGDSVVDIQAGNAVNARTVLVLTGYGVKAREQCLAGNIHIDTITPTIVEAVEFILNTLNNEQKSNE